MRLIDAFVNVNNKMNAFFQKLLILEYKGLPFSGLQRWLGGWLLLNFYVCSLCSRMAERVMNAPQPKSNKCDVMETA